MDFRESDKLGHLLGYGLLMFWFCQLYFQRRTRVRYAVGFLLMGVGLEFIQGAMGYRRYDVLDMYANTLGVLLGWALALTFARILSR